MKLHEMFGPGFVSAEVDAKQSQYEDALQTKMEEDDQTQHLSDKDFRRIVSMIVTSAVKNGDADRFFLGNGEGIDVDEELYQQYVGQALEDHHIVQQAPDQNPYAGI